MNTQDSKKIDELKELEEVKLKIVKSLLHWGMQVRKYGENYMQYLARNDARQTKKQMEKTLKAVEIIEKELQEN